MNGGTFLLELVGMKIRRTLLFGIVLTRPLNFDFGPPTGDKHWPELVDDSFFPPVLFLSLSAILFCLILKIVYLPYYMFVSY